MYFLTCPIQKAACIDPLDTEIKQNIETVMLNRTFKVNTF